MTDEELIELAALKCDTARPRPTWSLRGLRIALDVFTPEIERRQLERMREWAIDKVAKNEKLFPLKVIPDFLDAFAKENGCD